MEFRYSKSGCNNIKGSNPMKYTLSAIMAFLSLSLVGCIDLYEPSAINEKPVRVQEEMLTHDVELSGVDDDYVGSLARHYTKHGGGPMDLIVTYDPRSYRNTAMGATNRISEIVSALRERGVVDINASIMPIKAQGDEARLLVTYNSFTAHAPEGCDELMPGMNGRLVGDSSEYKLGCSIKTMMARQVAKPRHLLGRGATGTPTDGRSAANIVDLYRMGEENTALEGESATDE
ncbi:MAG: hypothetical protein COA45_01910 [Zetaproteobacteria bacterium]|nr:MAG: hypothetical protein COA45_01910 [Zetaproteobacteria bacterium]